MSEAQKNKIDFILNRGKEKSLIFRAAFYWYELDPLYKGITVTAVLLVSFATIFTLNVFAGLGALIFGTFGLLGLEQLGESVTDSMCESVVYDTVESKMEIMTEEEFRNDPVVQEQNIRVVELDIEKTLNSCDQQSVAHAETVSKMASDNLVHQEKLEALERGEGAVKGSTSNKVIFWQGEPVEEQIVSDVARELGLS